MCVDRRVLKFLSSVAHFASASLLEVTLPIFCSLRVPTLPVVLQAHLSWLVKFFYLTFMQDAYVFSVFVSLIVTSLS